MGMKQKKNQNGRLKKIFFRENFNGLVLWLVGLW